MSRFLELQQMAARKKAQIEQRQAEVRLAGLLCAHKPG